MISNNSKVTIHMVSSLDGYIAKENGNVSWMQSSDHYAEGIPLTETAIEEFIKGIDCYIMGSKTYEQALDLGWPYGAVPVVVLTKRDLVSQRESVEFYSGSLSKLINNQLKPTYHNIWMVGGAQVAKDFLHLGLADDIIISIIPIILGNGTPFFDQINREQALHLTDVKAYKDGMVELWYEVKKE